MLHIIKKYAGVSLVEVMLVLFISSLIAIAAFQYQKTQNENAVAAEFAERMYEYSQAIRMFADEHEPELAGGMAAPFTSADAPGSTFTQNGTDYIITGVDWLTVVDSPVTGQPYLPESFTFDNLQPLQLQRAPGPGGAGTPLVGNLAIQVDLSGSAASATQITIHYGALYDVANPSNPAVPKASVTSKAAKIASSLNDPLMGPSSFDYVGGNLDADGVMFPIVATIKRSTIAGENYLRLDGTNSMLDNLSFDVVNGLRRDIIGLNNIEFATAGGNINNANMLTFNANAHPDSSAGTIANVKIIEFKATGGIINQLDTLNFSTAGAGKITGVKSIEFPDGRKFSGFRDPIFFETCGDGSCSNNDFTGDSSTFYQSSRFLCVLNKTRTNDGDNGNNKSCSLKIVNGYYVVHFENALTCGMVCFQYRGFQE